MKFYDKGFIDIYDNYVDLQIFSTGVLALHLKVYQDKICQSTFKCINAQEFNNEYLTKSYKSSFLYDLLNQPNIYYKNKKDKIFIKVK